MDLFAKTFYCPNLVSQGDEMIIAEALGTSPGIELVEIDVAAHTVFAKTANQDGLTDVEFLLREAGYPPAESVPAPNVFVV
jgi:copper chaperone CopZ